MSLCGNGVLLMILLLLQELEGMVPPKALQGFSWKHQNNMFFYVWGVSIQTKLYINSHILADTGGKPQKPSLHGRLLARKMGKDGADENIFQALPSQLRLLTLWAIASRKSLLPSFFLLISPT